MGKTYTIVPNKKQLKAIKGYWKLFCSTQDEFYAAVGRIENLMESETGIKGIEFIHTDMGWCGVGNADRTMKLIQLDPV